MSADAWQTLGTILALVLIGAYNAWRTHRAEQAAKKAEAHAECASAQTVSTGNGFARDVKNSLSRLEAQGNATHQLMVEHLADHAGHDLRRRSL